MMLRETLFVLLTALAGVVAVLVLSAVLLGMGSLLSRVFAVSVFEASVVTLIVSGAITWLFARVPMSVGSEAVEPEEEVEEWLRAVPLPPLRASKRRHR